MQVKKCCSGFYGSECYSCPGGHQKPCSGHGRVSNAKFLQYLPILICAPVFSAMTERSEVECAPVTLRTQEASATPALTSAALGSSATKVSSSQEIALSLDLLSLYRMTIPRIRHCHRTGHPIGCHGDDEYSSYCHSDAASLICAWFTSKEQLI